MNCKK